MVFDPARPQRLALCIMIIFSVFLAGCVQPTVETSGTPGTTQIAVVPTVPANGQGGPTPAPIQPSNDNVVRIQQYFQQNLNIAVNNVQVINQYQLPSGLDSLYNFVYQNEFGQNCVGIIQATTQQVLVGDARCSNGTSTMAGALLFQPLNNPNFYVAVYGYVDPVAEPNAGAVAVVFPNGSSNQQNLTNFGFIVPQQGLEYPSQVVFIRTDGNTINILQVQ